MKILIVATTPDEVASLEEVWHERGIEPVTIVSQEDVTLDVIAQYDIICATRARATRVRQGLEAHTRLETERQRERELLQRIVDNIPVCIDIIDAEGNFIWVNREFERVFGYSPDEVRGRKMLAEFYPDPAEQKTVLDYINTAGGGWLEFQPVRRDGTRVWQSWANVRLSDGTHIGFGYDISERKTAEKLRDRFIEQVIQAQEEERRRLALELHDETGQSLTTLLVGLKALEDELEDAAQSARVGQLRELTSKLVKEVGRLARGLRPSALDDLGFAPAVEMHVAEFGKAHSLRLDLHMSGFQGRARLRSKIETYLYRIIQEALTNIVKHAQATDVSVVLRHDGERVQAIVEDNGRGLPDIDPRSVDTRLATIRERVALLGGEVKIESSAGKGTSLFVTIPL